VEGSTTAGDVIRKTRKNGTATEETKEVNKEELNRDKFQGFLDY
jgi:hypothetical protein